MFKNPFSNLSRFQENKMLFLFLVLLIITTIVMSNFNVSLVNEVCENGIVTFELAKDVSFSEAILDSWNEQSKISAALSLGFDYLYLIVYATFIALLIYKVTRHFKNSSIFSKFSNLLIWSMFVAALFDAVENVALIKLLQGDIKQIWSSIAYYFAIAKFAIIGCCIIYIIVNLFALVIKKIKK